jgi:hypothetical protein
MLIVKRMNVKNYNLQYLNNSKERSSIKNKNHMNFSFSNCLVPQGIYEQAFFSYYIILPYACL